MLASEPRGDSARPSVNGRERHSCKRIRKAPSKALFA
jgi:hypothetical protein